MVKCPRCDNEMQYVKTDVEAMSTKEKVIVIDVSAYYHCPSCYSDLTLRYNEEVKLK